MNQDVKYNTFYSYIYEYVNYISLALSAYSGFIN